jgi:CHAD domain-containing protein
MPSEVDRSYELKGDEELGAGLKRVAAGRVEKALERLREEEDRAKAVHGARKDLKKLRTVLRLVKDELPSALYKEEGQRYRDAGRALSAARDATVRLETLELLVEAGGELPVEAIETWRAILDRDREAAANVAADEGAVVELLEAGLTSIRQWPLAGDSWRRIGASVKRTYRRGRRGMRAAERDSSEDNLHSWRKRAKDLWYEFTLLTVAWPHPLEALADEAHRLTELLGDHHDLALLREDLHERRLGDEETRKLQAVIDQEQERLTAEAFDLGRRLYAEGAKAFAHRLHRYWQVVREPYRN